MIKINGDVVRIKTPFSIREIKSEDYDEGKITVLSKRVEKYQHLDIVDIQDGLFDKQFVVNEDVKVTLNSQGLMEHEITLLEPIFYFKSVYPAGQMFDTLFVKNLPNQTLRSILDVYIVHLFEYENIALSYQEGDYLDVEIPEKEFAEGYDFETILRSLFKRALAYPKVRYVEGFGWELYPDLIHELGEERIFKKGAQSVVSDPYGYATRIKSMLKNAILENTELATFPSKNGYIIPRSNSAKVSDFNVEYKLPSDIISIEKIEILDIEYRTIENAQTVRQDVDITDYVVEKQEYESLSAKNIFSPTSEPNKGNTLIYDLENNVITNLFGESGFALPIIGNIGNANIIGAAVTSALATEGKISQNIPTKAQDYKMRIKYRKRRDISFNHHRNNFSHLNYSTQVYNQNDSYINAKRFANQAKTLSNRLSNDVVSNTKTFGKMANYYKISDYNENGEIITDINYTVYQDIVQVQYELTENYANIQAEYALSRTPSPFSITKKEIITNPIKNEYLILSTVQKPNRSRLNNEGSNVLLDVLSTNAPAYNTPIEGAVYRRVSNAEIIDPAIHLEIEPIVGGNNITLHTQFRHKLVAGYELIEDNEFQEPILYTDQFGRAEGFNIFYTKDTLVEDIGEYPRVDSIPFESNALSDVSKKDMIFKQPNTVFNYTYAINFISETKDLMYGPAFSKLNHLIKKAPNEGYALKLYESNKPYYIMQEKIGGSDTLVTSGYTFNLALRRLTVPLGIKHWAIAYNGEILIAGNNINTVYFNLTDTPPNRFDTLSRMPSPQFITSFTERGLNSITVYVNNASNETATIEVVANAETKTATVNASTTQAFEFIGLTVDTEYTFRARAIRLNGSQYDVDSLAVNYNVKTLDTVIETPTVNTTDILHDRATFDITNEDVGTVDITIEYREFGGVYGNYGTFAFNANQTQQITVDGLTENTNYQFRFQALPSGTNPRTASEYVTKLFKTLVLFPVAKPTLSVINVDKVDIEFTITNNDSASIRPVLRLYNLTNPATTEIDLSPNAIQAFGSVTYNVSGLNPQTNYEAEIIAYPTLESDKVQESVSDRQAFQTQDVPSISYSTLNITDVSIAFRILNNYSFPADTFVQLTDYRNAGNQNLLFDYTNFGTLPANGFIDVILPDDYNAFGNNLTLLSDMFHMIKIRAGYNNNEEATLTRYETTSQVPEPLAPPSLSVSNQDYTSITINVTNNEAQSVNMEAYYKRTTSSNWIQAQSMGMNSLESNKPYTFSNLDDGVSYDFRFRASIGSDYSDYSFITSQTLALPNISNFDITLSNNNTYQSILCNYQNNTGHQINLILNWYNQTIGESLGTAQIRQIANATSGIETLSINNNANFYDVGQEIVVRATAVYNDTNVGYPVPDQFIDKSIILPRPQITEPDFNFSSKTEDTITFLFRNSDSTVAVNYEMFAITEEDGIEYGGLDFEQMPSYRNIVGTAPRASGSPTLLYPNVYNLLPDTRYIVGIKLTSQTGEYQKIERLVTHSQVIQTDPYSGGAAPSAYLSFELDYAGSTDFKPLLRFTNNSGEVADYIGYAVYERNTTEPTDFNNQFNFLNNVQIGQTEVVSNYAEFDGTAIQVNKSYTVKAKLKTLTSQQETEFLYFNFSTFVTE